jgi:hypothetical protein
MKRFVKIAVAAAGGAVLLGAVVATPVLAMGQQSGAGNGGPGWGGPMNGGAGCMRYGDNVAVDPTQVLTDAQRKTLADNAVEEKVAHDLYEAFAARYSTTPVFQRIASAETNHLPAVRTVLTRYQVADPTAGAAAGKFTDSAVQANYDQLLAKGNASLSAALEVGRTVENTDIAQLRTAIGGVTAPDVQRVYNHLLTASEMHLAAFTNQPGR